MLVNGILLHVKRDEVEHAKASIIITHGIAEHSGRYDEITQKLNEDGYTVVRYDLRGHGQSQGARGALKSYHQFIDDLNVLVSEEKKLNAKKIFLIGHSMGGLIVNLYAVKYPKSVHGIISSAAPTYFIKDVLPFRFIGYKWLGFVNKKNDLADDSLSRIKEVENDYVSDPLNLKVFKFSLAGNMFVGGVRYFNKHLENYETPVLILHGSADKIVPVIFSERLHQLIPHSDKKLIVYENSYHEIFNDLDREKVFTDVIEWLNKKIA